MAVIETGLLVKPLDDAVTVNVPFLVAVAVTRPPVTVAIPVSLDTHVAVAVMSCPPLQDAFRVTVVCCGVSEPGLDGVITGALVQAIATVIG